MKPSWSDAPEWAKYLAMDEDGSWFWYEGEPYFDDDIGIWRSNLPYAKWSQDIPGWRDTLEPRPLDTST